METALKKLEGIKLFLQQKIENRETAFAITSKEWQNSKKGKAFLDKTRKLYCSSYNISMAIKNLKTFYNKTS